MERRGVVAEPSALEKIVRIPARRHSDTRSNIKSVEVTVEAVDREPESK